MGKRKLLVRDGEYIIAAGLCGDGEKQCGDEAGTGRNVLMRCGDGE